MHKTAYEMRVSDWSSDVCSSDLTGAGCVGHDFQLAGCLGVADHFPGDDLGARDHQARIGIPQRALDDALVDQRHQLLHLLRRDHLDPAAEGAAGADPALELAHPFVVALAGDLDAADARVAAALLAEVEDRQSTRLNSSHY